MRLFIRHALFVYVVALIGTVGSERFFWYWSDDPLSHLEGAFFYCMPVAAFLLALRRYGVHSLWGLVMALPFYAYVTEGVITPVLYSGGPTPIFPLWFTGWHGLLSMLVLFVGIRYLAIERRTGVMAGVAVALGAFWGTWLITSLLPSQLEDPELIEGHGTLVAMEPAAFAGYVTTFTAILLGSHLLLNHVWPRSPQKLLLRTEKPTVGLLLFFAASWTVTVPWALPMFVVLGWLQVRVLRRHRDASPTAPSMLTTLGAPASARSLLPLALIAPVASAAYAIWWKLEPSETTLNVIYFGTIAIQTLAATALLFVAWRRIPRAAASESPLSQPTMVN